MRISSTLITWGSFEDWCADRYGFIGFGRRSHLTAGPGRGRVVQLRQGLPAPKSGLRRRRRGPRRRVHRRGLVRHRGHALRGPERHVRLRARQLRELRRERGAVRLPRRGGHQQDLRRAVGGGTAKCARLDARVEGRRGTSTTSTSLTIGGQRQLHVDLGRCPTGHSRAAGWTDWASGSNEHTEDRCYGRLELRLMGCNDVLHRCRPRSSHTLMRARSADSP